MADEGASPVERPDTDDYDLLTFGEVTARLAEELKDCTAELRGLRSADPPDADRIRHLEERIDLLRRSGERYRRDQEAGEAFTRRFGSAISASPDQPRWD
jgi:hypothetical protein